MFLFNYLGADKSHFQKVAIIATLIVFTWVLNKAIHKDEPFGTPREQPSDFKKSVRNMLIMYGLK